MDEGDERDERDERDETDERGERGERDGMDERQERIGTNLIFESSNHPSCNRASKSKGIRTIYVEIGE